MEHIHEIIHEDTQGFSEDFAEDFFEDYDENIPGGRRYDTSADTKLPQNGAEGKNNIELYTFLLLY